MRAVCASVLLAILPTPKNELYAYITILSATNRPRRSGHTSPRCVADHCIPFKESSSVHPKCQSGVGHSLHHRAFLVLTLPHFAFSKKVCVKICVGPSSKFAMRT